MAKFFRVLLKNSIRRSQAYGVGSPICGVAIWCFPHQKRIDILGLFRAGLLRLLFHGFLRPFLRAVKIFRIIEDLQSKYNQESDYYLNMLAVSPEAQGQGFASKLVKPFLDKAEAESTGVYVETMTLSDVRLHEHFGFQCMEEKQVKAGFSIWALYRRAKR
jgi:ribosomal protein S18 acetylase RimI-like enzyme